MTKSRSLATTFLPSGAWTGATGALALGALVWLLPTWVNLGVEQLIGAPVNTAGGGLTARFVESQVAVFWWAVILVGVLGSGALLVAWAYASLLNARSIAAGEGRRAAGWLFVALVAVGCCLITAGLPRAIFDPVDQSLLSVISPLVSFAQRSPAGGWIFAIGWTGLVCCGLAAGLRYLGWIRGWRRWELGKFRQIIGKADA